MIKPKNLQTGMKNPLRLTFGGTHSVRTSPPSCGATNAKQLAFASRPSGSSPVHRATFSFFQQ